MCIYLRLGVSIFRNLLSRLAGDARDWLVFGKGRLLYKLGTGYDDVGLDQVSLPPQPDGTLSELTESEGLHLAGTAEQAGSGSEAHLKGPWYQDVDRKTAEELVTKGGEGYFLIRNSSCHPLTLTLYHGSRAFNVPIRRREDGRIALGSAKPLERTFESLEKMISYYSQEELVLYSGGVRTGRARLRGSVHGSHM